MGGITGTITDAIASAGVYAVFGLMAIDALFPAASEVVMLYAGALAAGAFPEHGVSLFGTDISSPGWAYVVMASAGALGYWIGGLIGWAIGYFGGRPLLDHYGRFLHLSPEKLDRAEEWFRRHGLYAVFLARNVPIVRSFISIPAGLSEIPFGPYALISLLGSLPWAFGFAGAGFALGTGWERVHNDFKYADYVALTLIIFAFAYLVFRYLRSRARARAAVD